jgi:hypothetical protein
VVVVVHLFLLVVQAVQAAVVRVELQAIQLALTALQEQTTSVAVAVVEVKA